MTRKCMLFIAALFLTVSILGQQPVDAKQPKSDTNDRIVTLSTEQKNVLAGLYKELFIKKKEIVSKYVEYGVVSEDKAQKIIARMNEHYAKLESSGFIPHRGESNRSGYKQKH